MNSAKVLSGMTILTYKCFLTLCDSGSISNYTQFYRRLSLNNSKLNYSSFTVSQAISHWEKLFKLNEIPEPELSIQNILAHVLGFHSVNEILPVSENKLSPEQENILDTLCQCRLARMPVQYIIKEWDFRDLRLKMRPPVFIPRPETEELIDIVLKHTQDINSFIEVGCGTGAISLSLLQALPKAKGVAIDRSIVACKLTLENAEAHNLHERIDILNCKLNDDGNLDRYIPFDNFDLLISNPPYIPSGDIANLEPEIKLYEDLRALEAGKDGLRIIKAMFKFANDHLKPNGDMFLEVNSNHPDIIKTFLEENAHYCLNFIKYYKDLFGNNRFVHIRKK
uniref:peptide chain release factor N(5)-glutamine methyltransferase n=1 Tax=Clastoptera arizonana TaxID=38151 RepID=A0A1B6C2J2_9HEMI